MEDTRHSMEPVRRTATVMFADISGYTSICEKMDLEEVTDIMNECFRFMGHSIARHGGSIDKFIGDCVMALFGVPTEMENAPHRAIETALEMKNRLLGFNEGRRLPGPLSFHIGINTGPVIACMMGSDLRKDFTVMGGTVNIASRMARAAETGTILITENTYRLTEGFFDFEPVGEIRVKGRERPVKAYKVLGPRRIIAKMDIRRGKGLAPEVSREVGVQFLDRLIFGKREDIGEDISINDEPCIGKSRPGAWTFRDPGQESK